MTGRRWVVVAVLSFLGAGSVGAQPREPELLLFAGQNHDVFLGCLNCSRFDGGSVCNRYGEYGNRYSELSIWNRYGDYGNRYSNSSPWNRYAAEPPVIVDRAGGFYGYFTANRTNDKRTRLKALLLFLDNASEVVADLRNASDTFCGR